MSALNDILSEYYQCERNLGIAAIVKFSRTKIPLISICRVLKFIRINNNLQSNLHELPIICCNCLIWFQKFFDSGDYAMNQQSKDKKILPPVMTLPTNDEIEKDIQKPIEIETEKHEPLSAPTAGAITINSSSIPEADDSDDESHLQIPRPDTVPQRKSSILHPSVHSKLSPTPLIHREHTDESVNVNFCTFIPQYYRSFLNFSVTILFHRNKIAETTTRISAKSHQSLHILFIIVIETDF